MGNDSSRQRPEGSRAPAPNKKVTAGGGGKATINEHLARAEKTGVVNLSKANIKELPPSIQQVSARLRTIDVSYNKLEALPTFIGELKMLRQLHANNNRIERLPDEIGCCKKLETLELHCNLLSVIPDSLAALSALRIVDLSNNRLTTMPASLCNLVAVEVLNLANNHITELPPADTLGRCNAAEINLNCNRLSDLNSGLAKCPRLKTLRIQENCLSIAAFTEEILAQSQITLLQAEGNLFQDKELHHAPGYEALMERYTDVRKKMY